MRIINATCPGCGANLELDSEKNQAFCQYCGTKVFIEAEKKIDIAQEAEIAGYYFEKGRQQASAMNYSMPNPAVNTTVHAPKKKKKTWWILGWIFMPMVPGTILLARSKKLKIGWKIGLISLIWLVAIAIGMSGEDTSTTSAPPMTSVVSSTVESSEQNVRQRMNWTNETENYEVALGETFYVYAQLAPAGCDIEDIVVNVSDETVVEVREITIKEREENSVIVAELHVLGTGSANVSIGLRSNPDCKTSEIVVTANSMGMILVTTLVSRKLEVGDVSSVCAEINSTGIQEDIEILSDNEAVVGISSVEIVEENGKTVVKFDIECKDVGDAIVTIRSIYGDRTATVDVHVDPKDTSRIVYVTPYGERYHYRESCAGENASQTTENKATARYLEPCGRCT